MRPGLVLVLTCAGSLLWGGPAEAQRPHGTPPGLLKKPTTPGQGSGGKPPQAGGSSGGSVSGGSGAPASGGSGGGASVSGGTAASAPGVPAFVGSGAIEGGGAPLRVRSLGVWLDDATAMAPGEAWLSMSMQRWGSPIGSGLEAPVFDVVGGVVENVHAFVSVPYSRTAYGDEPATGELGTIYAGSKVVLRQADDRRLGVAVTPTLEILSTAATTDTGFSRLNAVIPVSLEWRQDSLRIYGSTGYFTRGAYFISGAVERALTDRAIVTGSLSQAWATDELALADEIGLRGSRTDASGSIAYVVSPHLMVFASAARTLSPLDLDATRYAFSVGASMNLYRPGRRLPIKKP